MAFGNCERVATGACPSNRLTVRTTASKTSRGAEVADGSNYREDDAEENSDVADGSNYRVKDEPRTEVADGSNYRSDTD